MAMTFYPSTLRYVADISLLILDLIVYRARRSEARIQQMLWKVNYSDIVFVNMVRVALTLVLITLQS